MLRYLWASSMEAYRRPHLLVGLRGKASFIIYLFSESKCRAGRRVGRGRPASHEAERVDVLLCIIGLWSSHLGERFNALQERNAAHEACVAGEQNSLVLLELREHVEDHLEPIPGRDGLWQLLVLSQHLRIANLGCDLFEEIGKMWIEGVQCNGSRAENTGDPYTVLRLHTDDARQVGLPTDACVSVVHIQAIQEPHEDLDVIRDVVHLLDQDDKLVEGLSSREGDTYDETCDLHNWTALETKGAITNES